MGKDWAESLLSWVQPTHLQAYKQTSKPNTSFPAILSQQAKPCHRDENKIIVFCDDKMALKKIKPLLHSQLFLLLYGCGPCQEKTENNWQEGTNVLDFHNRKTTHIWGRLVQIWGCETCSSHCQTAHILRFAPGYIIISYATEPFHTNPKQHSLLPLCFLELYSPRTCSILLKVQNLPLTKWRNVIT